MFGAANANTVVCKKMKVHAMNVLCMGAEMMGHVNLYILRRKIMKMTRINDKTVNAILIVTILLLSTFLFLLGIMLVRYL